MVVRTLMWVLTVIFILIWFVLLGFNIRIWGIVPLVLAVIFAITANLLGKKYKKANKNKKNIK